MPIQAPQWTDYLNCPACCREFSPRRSPISLSCGHTLCRPCIKNLIRKQCPFDQSVISVDLEELVVNTALLQLMGYDPPAQPIHPSSIQSLSEQDRRAYDVIIKSLEQLAGFLKYCCTASVNMIGSRLSRPMQRKLVTLLQCSLMDDEGRGKAARAARSLGERTVSELILQHQNPQQLSANLWAAVRSRGCQFLGPAMQEEVLKLVLLALEDGSPLSRKVLVMFVVQRLEPHFSQASKTSIGHVVQLLYRASCFKVSKRDADSSLMQLKEEFRSYECLRREHDAQIVQIATESGLRIAPDQWSALLYGDTLHKSHMQSIIDKLQTPHSFAQSVQELFFALQRTDDPAQLLIMSLSLDRITNIDPSPDAKSPSWQELSQIMSALKDVVSGLVDYMQHNATARDANHNLKTDRLPDATTQPSTIGSLLPGRYKVAMCRDAQANTPCPRGNNCTYAHTEEELERYRRQETPNALPAYPTSPQPIGPMMPSQFNYPPPAIDTNYKRTPMQQLSPSAGQQGMPDNGGVPNRQSFDSHQPIPPPPNQPIRSWSYANALEFGPANNYQRRNQNHPVGAPGSIAQPCAISPADGGIMHPGGHLNPANGGMIHHNRDTNVSMNILGGGGILPPLNGGMLPPLNGGMLPPLNGGMLPPLNGGMPSPLNGGMPLPLNGGIPPPLNGGIPFPLTGGMLSPLHGGMPIPFNGGIATTNAPSAASSGYSHDGGFYSIDDIMTSFNEGTTSPKDSRYFPRRQPEKTEDLQSPKDSTQKGGDSAVESMEQEESEWEVPEFIPRSRANAGIEVTPSIMDTQELPRYGSNAAAAEQQSFGTYRREEPKVENSWQVASSMQQDSGPLYAFTKVAQNVPEGAQRYDPNTMDINIGGKPYHQRYPHHRDVYQNNSYVSKYPPNSNYNQPTQAHQQKPSMQNMLGPNKMQNEPNNKDLYTELATNMLRQQQHLNSQNMYQHNQFMYQETSYMSNYASNYYQPMVDQYRPSMLDMPGPKMYNEPKNKQLYPEVYTNILWRQPMFEYNSPVQNHPEGVQRYNPETMNTKFGGYRHNQRNPQNRNVYQNKSNFQLNPNQPTQAHQHKPSMQDMPGPNKQKQPNPAVPKNPDEENVLAALHVVAKRVTPRGSDTETDSIN